MSLRDSASAIRLQAVSKYPWANHADKVAACVDARNARGAASHRVVQNRFALVGVCAYQVFQQGNGLLGGV